MICCPNESDMKVFKTVQMRHNDTLDVSNSMNASTVHAALPRVSKIVKLLVESLSPFGNVLEWRSFPQGVLPRV